MKKFGRYSDINKSKHQLNEWDAATNNFQQNQFLLGFQHLLNFIQNPEKNNVEYYIQNDILYFTVYHNQLKITGQFTNQNLSVSLPIAILNHKPLPLLRKILSLNYELNYARFVLQDNTLILKGTLTAIEYNPYIIYNLIQEIALKGDMIVNSILNDKAKGDKLEEVKILKNFNTFSDLKELEHKWNLLNEWITQTINRSNEISLKAITGGASYLLLNLAYRIDYFLAPTGPLQIAIEKVNNDFFNEDNLSTEEKNKKMIESFLFIQNKLQYLPKYLLFTNSVYSFSFTNNTKIENIISHFVKSLENYVWYSDNNYPDIALECFEYGALYNTFNFKVPTVLEDLFELFLLILNYKRIAPLNYPYELYSEKPKFLIKSKFLGIFGKEEYSHFNIHQIQTLIHQINQEHKSTYPKFQFRFENLVFDNLLSFVISFTKELSQCDFNTYNNKS